MRCLILSSILALSVQATPSEWQFWKQIHRKSYQNKVEDTDRYKIFLENKQHVISHNLRYDQELETFYLGLNSLADLTLEEFMARYTQGKVEDPVLLQQFDCPEQFDDTTTAIPDNYDWRDASQNDLNLVAVTPVKDQGSCGSCWTFGATGTMEGGLCMQNVYECSGWAGLSEQNMLNCASGNRTFLGNFNNNGCGGGEQSNGIRWSEMAGGISTSEDYPYTAVKTDCTQPAFGATVTDGICGTTSYNGADSPLLARAVMKKGPVTIGIDAGGLTFQLYSGGVYTSNTCSGNRINHAVTTVGFGVDSDDSSLPYWIIKNSWGSSWGLAGYIWVERGVDMCGVERDTQYALMSAVKP